MTLVAIYYHHGLRLPTICDVGSESKFIECCELIPTDWAHLINQETGGRCDPALIKKILTSLEGWIPKEISQFDPDYDRTYRDGWNAYRDRLLMKLK